MLQSSLTAAQPNQLERVGIIQCYEMAFELTWKTLKDYLQEQGFEATSPRQAIKQGFQAQTIKEEHNWIKALEDRNLIVHTYDETKAQEVERDIRNVYARLIRQLVSVFEEQAAK